MNQKIVVRLHLDTKNAIEPKALEKGWKVPHLISEIIEENISTYDPSTHKVIKDEYRHLRKGVKELRATNQMSIYLSDYAIERIKEISDNHRDRTISPSSVIRDIVQTWAENNTDFFNQ